MARAGLLASALTLFLPATAALAQSNTTSVPPPDLKGVWTGTSESIVNGPSNHFTDAPTTKLLSLPFTLTVTMQDGRRFAGTMASDKSQEDIVGIVNRAGTILWVDEDGYNTATMIDSNRLEVCYLHTKPLSQVASCIEMQRRP